MGEVRLSNPERRMLAAMQGEAGREWLLDDVLSACSWHDQAQVVGAGQGLAEAGLVEVSEMTKTVWSLGKEGHAANSRGLLEKRLWDWLISQPDDQRSMGALNSAGFERHETGPGIGLLKGLGVEIIAGNLVFEGDQKATDSVLSEKANFLASLVEGADEATLDAEMLAHFKGRKGLVEASESVNRTWKITSAGMAIDSTILVEAEQISDITPELLQGDSWRSGEFKPYDVNLESTTPATGKTHPMQALIERIRAIFLEMGFSEIAGDYVQTAGWNMDSLFIPQDHPAREMQDTFYLDNPSSIPIDSEHLQSWREIHEHGGETGSTGWGGKFSDEIAQKGLLRTHTTVNTIRHLAENPTDPCRVFAVGRVFRKESIDRTHLPEFHQIEGIIMEPDASLPMLVTTLKTFYSKMGYPEVRVRPAYFPYTEPSLEVEVKWRGKWLELGGAGIFRPEVTEPLGCSAPVCAWGMGLERLAMLVLGLDDIRQLYLSDLEWLRSQPIL